jgi:putative hydrolase of the HAD superfamily
MKIAAISFDFWNTIYHDYQHTYERHSERVRFFSDALQRSGYKDELDIEGSFKYCWEYFDKIWKNEHRTPNAKELLKVGCDFIKVQLPDDEFDAVAKFFEEILLKYPPEPFADVKEVIQILAQKYKLGITSDTAYTSGRVLRQLLEKDGLLQYFSGFTFSDEIGCSKPDPVTFRNTMAKLGSHPHDTIHVGDNEYTDIEGAKEIGMKTIMITEGLEDKNKETEADYKVNNWTELLELLHFI